MRRAVALLAVGIAALALTVPPALSASKAACAPARHAGGDWPMYGHDYGNSRFIFLDSETSTGLVLVDFWAEWCGPCRRLAPTVDALASDYDGRATVAKMNVDENPNVPSRFAIRGIPTLLLFKDGQLAETIVGLQSKEDIAATIERHL